MAAGKSTVARAVAARLGWRAEDVDELIEARERRTIAEIFARQGEPYFRGVEREILKLLLPLRHAVVATGGGTFMDAENRAAINLDGVSVWLDVPFDLLIARVPADGRRPLAADRAQMERLFAVRQAAYAQAHLRIDAGAAPAEAIAEQIFDRIASDVSPSRAIVRYLILSDIHANIDALEAVLDAAPATGTVRSCSATWSATAASRTPSSTASAALDPMAVIRGNHDKAACGLDDGSEFQSRGAIRGRVDLPAARRRTIANTCGSCRRGRPKSTS